MADSAQDLALHVLSLSDAFSPAEAERIIAAATAGRSGQQVGSGGGRLASPRLRLRLAPEFGVGPNASSLDPLAYSAHLQTRAMGQVLLVGAAMPSTQNVLAE